MANRMSDHSREMQELNVIQPAGAIRLWNGSAGGRGAGGGGGCCGIWPGSVRQPLASNAGCLACPMRKRCPIRSRPCGIGFWVGVRQDQVRMQSACVLGRICSARLGPTACERLVMKHGSAS